MGKWILSALCFLSLAAKRPDLASEFRQVLKDKEATYVISNADIPYSYDPIDDLSLNNSRIIRMIHSRIIESDIHGRGYSALLESYNYHESKRTLILKVKKDFRFSDGSLLTPNDIAITIKRNALLNPRLPGIVAIKGHKDWLKNKFPLKEDLEGVVVKDQRVFVSFDYDVEIVTDKFTGAFGVLPAKTIDLTTGKLNTKNPPTSGPYVMVPSIVKDGTKVTAPTFLKFENIDGDPKKPKVVWIANVSPSNIGKYIDSYHDNVVICANEIDIKLEDLKKYRSEFKVHTSPKVMFSFLMLNPASEAFKDQRVRQYFSQKFREKMKAKGYDVESALQSKNMIGYQTHEELSTFIPTFSRLEESQIIEHLKKNPPLWVVYNSMKVQPFHEIFMEICKDLNIPIAQHPKEYNHEWDLWDKGVYGVKQAFVTIGPATPTGDIKTVFSGIHPFLKGISNDDELQELVFRLNFNDKLAHFMVNKHLFVESKMSVVSNYSRLYFSTGKPTLHAFRLTEPLTWEFFQ